MSARTLGWLILAGLAVVVIALGGPGQAWAKATSYLQTSTPTVSTHLTTGSTGGGGSVDSGPEEPGDP